jgi:hypothetical protein
MLRANVSYSAKRVSQVCERSLKILAKQNEASTVMLPKWPTNTTCRVKKCYLGSEVATKIRFLTVYE